MQVPKIKFKVNYVSLACWTVFALLVLYEVYFMWSSYVSVTAPSALQVSPKSARIDQAALSASVNRYNAAVNYAAPAENIPDPFATPSGGTASRSRSQQ